MQEIVSNRLSEDYYENNYLSDERKVENKLWLANDVERIIIETDEESPTTIAVIGDVIITEDGYRARVKFEV